jgi:hypothetical protein
MRRALRREEEPESMVEPVDREDDRDPERSENLDAHPQLRDPPHDVRSRDVERRLDRQQDQHDQEDRRVVRRIPVGPEPVVGQSGDVSDDSVVDGGDGDEKRDAVEPADEPAVCGPDGELAVLVEGACDRVVARELTEDERDEEHPDERDERQPDVGRPGECDAEDEERVDAHHRRQVRERDREVREESEHAVQLRLVAEALEP